MRVGTVERDVVVRSNNNDMRVKAEYTRLHYTAKTNEIADIRAAAVANNQHRYDFIHESKSKPNTFS